MSENKTAVASVQLDLNTEIVVFGWFAEGYYSGAKSFESMILPTEQYKQFKMDEAFDGAENYVYDLDGKHSEVESEFKKYTTTVKDLLLNEVDYNFVVGNMIDLENTNDSWYNELFGENGLYQFNLYDLAQNYINQLVSFEEKTAICKILVRKDKVEELNELLNKYLADE